MLYKTIKFNIMKITTKTLLIFGIPLLILAIPLIAMQFTSEVNWTISDFLIMGFLLYLTAFCINFIIKKVSQPGKRFFYIALAFLILLLIWAELAVGIFGSPFAGS